MRSTMDLAVTPRSALGRLGPLLLDRDPVGVLSVYVDAGHAAFPDASIETVRTELKRVVTALGKTHGREVAGVAANAEREIAAALERPGRQTFVLFTGLGQNSSVKESLPPLGLSRVTLGPRADVRQLCRGLQAARPAGAVLLDGRHVRVLKWIPGALDEVWAEVMPELEGSDLLGPAHAHVHGVPGTAPGFKASQQRDLYERRLHDESRRFLASTGPRLSELAAEHGWKEIVVAGDGEWADALTTALGPGAPDVILAPRMEQWRSLGQLADDVGELITNHRAGRETTLVRRIREEARLGSVGLHPVVEALCEGRVDSLLIPAEGAIRGWSSADASVLSPSRVLPPGLDADDVIEDEMLADAMIARAFASGADVVALSAAGAGALGDLGVGAILRW
jgi:Bacterial archaeo-eukaryotic release factor family 10